MVSPLIPYTKAPESDLMARLGIELRSWCARCALVTIEGLDEGIG